MKKTFICFFIIAIISLTMMGEHKTIIFLSTQLNPVEEANSMRNTILKDFKKNVSFMPYSDRDVFAYLSEEKQEKPDLIGGIYGDFVSLKEKKLLKNVDSLSKKLNTVRIIPKFNEMAKLGTENQYFIPWMQATYLMAANKKALAYLPKNTDINNLKYEDLIKWGENIAKATGENKIGLPVGKNGLWHRFLQGCAYPSYTGEMYSKFNSKDGEKMWGDLKQLWQYVNSESLTFNKMSEPLLSEKIWIAWDHIARIVDIFKEKPDDFICFPVPSGPKGRGYMMVIAGLGITEKTDRNPETENLIKYLLSEKTQVLMMETIGFFPVVELSNTKNLKYKEMYNTILLQSKGKNAIITMPPTNIGSRSDEFNMVYLRAFSQIVLRESSIKETLEEQFQKIQDILNLK